MNKIQEALEKLSTTVNERIEKIEDTIKCVIGDSDDAAKAIAECPDLVKQLREEFEKYSRQLPQLTKTDGSEKDSEYEGFWPNATRAAQFGNFVAAGLSPDPAIRESCAKALTETGIKLRNAKGQYVKHEDYVKAMGESSDSLGGYLVPDELMHTIIRHVNKYGVARQRLRKVPMSRQTQSWIVATDGLTVYYPDEAEAATPSDASFAKVQLVAKRWAVVVWFSKELDEDSIVALGEYMANEMALALAKAEDRNTFMGDGTSAYGGITGVLSSSNVAVVSMPAGKTEFTDVEHDDFIRLKYAVEPWVREMPDCGYYMCSGVTGICERLKDADGRPLYNHPADNHPLRIAGDSVASVQAMPDVGDSAADKKFVAYGSLMAWGILAQRRSMALDRNDSLKWLEDQIGVKAVPRLAIKEVIGEAMAVLKTAAT